MGCGTGRVLKCLLEKGLTNITGVDISDEMLKLAQKKLDKYLHNKALIIEEHDFSTETLQGVFDKVFVTFYTFNYILENPVKFLRNIGSSMRSNALIIIDLFYPKLFLEPELDGVWSEREIKIGDNRSVILRDKREFDGNLEKRVQVFVDGDSVTTIETTRRFYAKEEMENLLHDTGFRNIKVIYGYSLGDSKTHDEINYPLFGINEFNVDLTKYTNREEATRNFIVYANKM